ncbi:MAG: metalloregulator ArsR/SmtB family transcription factor [Deltaproteobacteria bacterium]|nr:metalloregulator ArsR/SmtB family transcription factor [Deltaproteobacteria bacterium]
MTITAAVDALNLLGDPTRVRLLALLGERELTVAELTRVLGLSQSRVSTHLGRLKEAGLVKDRRAGAQAWYVRAQPPEMPEPARSLWATVGTLDDPTLEGDRARLRRWPEGLAGEMERHYSPGRTWEATARALAVSSDLGDVLDAGSGDGTVAELLAPRARRVVCVDRSEAMIAAARRRLAGRAQVRCEVGDLAALAEADASFDLALCLNVLVHVESPPRVLAELQRVLRPGGRLTLVTLAAHRHAAAAAEWGHRHLGFAPRALARLLARAGLEVESCAVTSQERRAPQFEIVTACARKGARKGVRS